MHRLDGGIHPQFATRENVEDESEDVSDDSLLHIYSRA